MTGIPVLERVLDNLRECLAGISTESGYSTTLRSVTRFQLNPFALALLPAASVYMTSDNRDRQIAYPYESRVLQVTVQAWMRETRKGTLDQDLVLLQQDVYLAVMQDIRRGVGPDGSENATETTYGGVRRLVAEGTEPIGGIDCDFAVQYRHMQLRPET